VSYSLLLIGNQKAQSVTSDEPLTPTSGLLFTELAGRRTRHQTPVIDRHAGHAQGYLGPSTGT